MGKTTGSMWLQGLGEYLYSWADLSIDQQSMVFQCSSHSHTSPSHCSSAAQWISYPGHQRIECVFSQWLPAGQYEKCRGISVQGVYMWWWEREGGTEITWQYDFLSEPSSPFNPESPMGNSFVPGLPVRILWHCIIIFWSVINTHIPVYVQFLNLSSSL